ncbi:MAG: lytic transglycosylase domain-containing protein [Sterolibacterium sp.]|nr:lytic transglycosylase domain-containing protein [Sterolibacterium sp.]
MKFWYCLFLLLPALAQAVPGDERILAAREAFRVGDRVAAVIADQTLAASGPHVLDVWVTYWNLRQQLGRQDSVGIPAFLAQQKNTYLAERLRGDWLRERGKQADWTDFASEYAQLEQPDTELRCYALQARLSGQAAAQALDEALPLWFEVLDLPESCKPVMDQLVASGRVQVDDIWTRIRSLLENKRYTMARSAASYLSGDSLPATRQLNDIDSKPQAYLARLPASFASSRPGRELVLFALQRLARSAPEQAAQTLEKLSDRLSPGERAYAWGQIAWQGARQHSPQALSWYALAGQDKTLRLSDEQLAWQVRAALRIRDWPRVLQAIEQMPAALASQPDWVYWRGRALASLGAADKARAQYALIAGKPNFYGNLADEELGRRIMVPPRARTVTSEEMSRVASHDGLQRALALFRLGLRFEGLREWNWTLRGMNDRQLLAAAELAQSNEIFDRAIYAAERTQDEHDFALRYLAPFRDHVLARSRQIGLDTGWVYGLMRQESRFVMNANSSAGAQGLMQLMPKTAAWVAKKIGMTDYHSSQVNTLDTNIVLGTNYMRMVMDDLDDHPVLASAAYNAGPARARRWRAAQPLEGAIYAETIPFDETRDYVKKVMSNAVYYTALFENQSQSLKDRLGVVPPRR